MHVSAQRVVATRQLTYALKGARTRAAFTVRIHEPFLVEPGSVDFNVSGRTSGCDISFEGVEYKGTTCYGADEVQALELAIQSMDFMLKRLSRTYDIFFEDGDSYFDE